MRGIIGDQRQSYRRGLVLGLTVAEALLLILFGLLLALGSVLVKSEEKAEARQRELNEVRVKLSALEFIEPRIPIPRGKEPDEFFKELGLLKMENDKLMEVNAGLKTQLREADIASGIAEVSKSTKASAEALRAAAARGKVLNDFFGSDTPIEKIERVLNIARTIESALPEAAGTRSEALTDLDELADQLATKERENGDLRSQVANAQRRLDQEGLGYLACWAMDAGTPDYVFDVGLLGDGILVRKGIRAERAKDYAQLPIPSGLTGRTLSESEFRNLTQALFDYSEKQQCRFFVRIYDFTPADQKVLYKRRMRTVEDHFYKYEVSDPLTWGKEAPRLLLTGSKANAGVSQQ